MNILVTGGTGFIGKYLVRSLLSHGHIVRCLSRNINQADKIFRNKNIELVKGDLTKPETLQNIAHGIDVVCHLAAAGHVSAISQAAFRLFYDINVQGTKNLLLACVKHNVKRFIHFSSTAAMGLPEKLIISEDTPCVPQTPYQKSKMDSESMVLSIGQKHNIEVLVLRPCLVYGPGGTGEFLRMCNLIKKGFFPRIGLGKNLTPIVHVADVVQGAIKALNKGIPGNVYLIASEKSPPLKTLHSLISKTLGIQRIYFYIPVFLAYLGAFLFEKLSMATGKAPFVSRKNIISVAKDRTFNISRAKKELDYQPAIPLSEGIRQTVSWFLEEKLV